MVRNEATIWSCPQPFYNVACYRNNDSHISGYRVVITVDGAAKKKWSGVGAVISITHSAADPRQ
jgi:hypothetical protein